MAKRFNIRMAGVKHLLKADIRRAAIAGHYYDVFGFIAETKA